MEYKKFGSKYIVRIDKGEEIVASLGKLCHEENIKSGWIKGIGAVNKATIGLFETKDKKYHSIELEGDHEITSLLGNIASMDGKVYLHLHINLSDMNFNVFGGHLNSAIISGTGEFFVDTIEENIERQFNDEVGLNLYKFN
jgi:predicted DNA-binding protein with PD1-like motif